MVQGFLIAQYANGGEANQIYLYDLLTNLKQIIVFLLRKYNI